MAERASDAGAVMVEGNPKSLLALPWAHKCAVSVQSGPAGCTPTAMAGDPVPACPQLQPGTGSGSPNVLIFLCCYSEQAHLQCFNIKKMRIKRRNEIWRGFPAPDPSCGWK